MTTNGAVTANCMNVFKQLNKKLRKKTDQIPVEEQTYFVIVNSCTFLHNYLKFVYKYIFIFQEFNKHFFKTVKKSINNDIITTCLFRSMSAI